MGVALGKGTQQLRGFLETVAAGSKLDGATDGDLEARYGLWAGQASALAGLKWSDKWFDKYRATHRQPASRQVGTPASILMAGP